MTPTARAQRRRTDEQEHGAQGGNAGPGELEQPGPALDEVRGARAGLDPAASADTSVAIAASARPVASSRASRRGIGPSRRTSQWKAARPRAASSPR